MIRMKGEETSGAEGAAYPNSRFSVLAFVLRPELNSMVLVSFEM